MNLAEFNKSTLIIGFIIGVMFFGSIMILIKPSSTKEPTKVFAANTKVFTVNELRKYNGSDPRRPIYLALDGYVYDVTPGKIYYQEGGSYHSLAGKDSSNELHLFGGSIIKKKYKIVGILAN